MFRRFLLEEATNHAATTVTPIAGHWTYFPTLQLRRDPQELAPEQLTYHVREARNPRQSSQATKLLQIEGARGAAWPSVPQFSSRTTLRGSLSKRMATYFV